MKKRAAIFLVTCLMFSLAACSPNVNSEQPSQTQTFAQTQEPALPGNDETEKETSAAEEQTEEVPSENPSTEIPSAKADEKKETSAAEGQTEEVPSENPSAEIPPTEADENKDPEMTADELLDLFVNGSINAVDPTDSTSTFYITDLNMDSEEWDAYSVGEKIDLDNDGENELILNGPYGGIYLDARDGQVYGFVAGEGDGFTLSYTYFKGAVWILYSNRMHQGYESYHMELFEGADNLVEEMNFNEELIDEDNAEGPERYYLNGTEITYDEYLALSGEIFAAQVNTN